MLSLRSYFVRNFINCVETTEFLRCPKVLLHGALLFGTLLLLPSSFGLYVMYPPQPHPPTHFLSLNLFSNKILVGDVDMSTEGLFIALQIWGMLSIFLIIHVHLIPYSCRSRSYAT